MSYFTEAQLRQAAGTASFSTATNRMLKSIPEHAETTIFLSHSHKDRHLAEGLKNQLADLGISLYIDWQDNEMPDKPNRETAQKIKKRISDMKIFLMLCTDNALNSRWVPWEIGVADSVKRHERILIAPVANAYGTFAGSEYLHLYRRIEIAYGNQLMIHEPNQTQGFVARDWLPKI